MGEGALGKRRPMLISNAGSADGKDRWRGAGLSGRRAAAEIGHDVSKRSERRFPPPWTVEEIGAAFVVE